jgi:hypothetical protein
MSTHIAKIMAASRPDEGITVLKLPHLSAMMPEMMRAKKAAALMTESCKRSERRISMLSEPRRLHRRTEKMRLQSTWRV